MDRFIIAEARMHILCKVLVMMFSITMNIATCMENLSIRYHSMAIPVPRNLSSRASLPAKSITIIIFPTRRVDGIPAISCLESDEVLGGTIPRTSNGLADEPRKWSDSILVAGLDATSLMGR
jgi:hypothetical protein